jgi:hypothetical protein
LQARRPVLVELRGTPITLIHFRRQSKQFEFSGELHELGRRMLKVRRLVENKPWPDN